MNAAGVESGEQHLIPLSCGLMACRSKPFVSPPLKWRTGRRTKEASAPQLAVRRGAALQAASGH
ncbi:hypothetical protein EYF80_056759 [Liparis tanakae]|uniref:Uncharacterized protein n=1 Tax=Liparis tanakae TaxID=230148 RepID=A0A4Z2EW93_9TELE|nr:hypothetical protein EYF80_056759 [Liparis tanakae]